MSALRCRRRLARRRVRFLPYGWHPHYDRHGRQHGGWSGCDWDDPDEVAMARIRASLVRFDAERAATNEGDET